MTRLALLLLLLLLLLLGCCTLTVQQKQPLITTIHRPKGSDGVHGATLLILGDWGRSQHPLQLQVAEAMTRVAQSVPITAIVSPGDNFYPNGVTSVSDPQFDTSWRQVYAHKALQVPWLVIAGNHDWHGSVAAQVEFSKLHPQWVFPAHYHEVHVQVDQHTCATLLMLETNAFVYTKARGKTAKVKSQTQPKQQLAWLKQRLAANTCQWLFLVGHHPPFSAGAPGDNKMIQRALIPLMTQYHVDAMIAGHIHNLQHIEARGIHVFTSGAGCRVKHDMDFDYPGLRFAMLDAGFMALTLTRTEAR